MFVGTLKEYNANTDQSKVIKGNVDQSTKVTTFEVPIAIESLGDPMVLNLIAKTSNATARRIELDFWKCTALVGNYRGTEDVTISSSVVKADAKGSLFVFGYPKTKNSNASNEFTAELVMKLSDGKATYDKVTIDTLNSPDGTNAYTVPADSDETAVGNDGTIVLTFGNTYKVTQQIKDGTNATIKMHVVSSAPYAEAGTWVSRSVAIDYEANKVTITGNELTPKKEETKQEESKQEESKQGETKQEIAQEASAGIAVGASEATGAGAEAATVKATSDTEVAYVAPVSKKAKKLIVPDTVTVNGKTYQVTSIAVGAFKGSKAKSLTLGKNISKVGKGALKGAKKLTKLELKTSKLNKTSMKNLLKGSKVKTIKLKGVSKKAKKNYKKWAKAYGVTVK